MDVEKRKHRRYYTRSLFSLLVISMLLLVNFVPTFASGVDVAVPFEKVYEIENVFSSVSLNNTAFMAQVTFYISDINKYVPAGVKFGEVKLQDTEERLLKTINLYGSNKYRYADGTDTLQQKTLLEAVTEGLIKLRKSDGTYVSTSDITATSATVNTDILYIEFYGPVKRTADSGNTVSILTLGLTQVVEAPLFMINNTTLSTVKDTDLVIGGTITSGFENADIEYRINDGSWSTTGVDHNGVGVFTITLNNSAFPYKTNIVDVRIRDQYGIYSKIVNVSVTNNFVDTENPNPNPGGGGNNNNPPSSGGSSGSLKINFNVGDMFTHSNSVLSGFMILLTVIVGISVGFRVVRFIKDLF